MERLQESCMWNQCGFANPDSNQAWFRTSLTVWLSRYLTGPKPQLKYRFCTSRFEYILLWLFHTSTWTRTRRRLAVLQEKIQCTFFEVDMWLHAIALVYMVNTLCLFWCHRVLCDFKKEKCITVAPYRCMLNVISYFKHREKNQQIYIKLHMQWASVRQHPVIAHASQFDTSWNNGRRSIRV